MYEIKKLREEMSDVSSEMNKLVSAWTAENRNGTEEEIQRFDVLDNTKSEIEAKLKTAERLERSKGVTRSNERPQLEVRSINKPVSGKDRRDAFRAFLLNAAGVQTSHLVRSDWRESAERLGYNLNSTSLIQRTDTGQDLTTSGLGSELIDGDIFVGIMNRLKAYGGMTKVADVFETENGSPIHYAFSDDTSNLASIVGENTTQDSVPVVYSEAQLSAYTYRSGIYPISWQLIQDSRIDVVADVSEKLAIRIGRRQNLDWTAGTGSGQPTGFLKSVDSSMALTTAAAGVVTYDDINTLIHTVDPDYREKDTGVCLMMNDATMAYLEQNLVDSNHRPLLLGPQTFGNVTGETPLRLAIAGQVFPIVINQQMPAVTQTAAPCIAFGWFKAYKARIVADLRIEVLRERYADMAAIGVQAYARSDGRLVDPFAIATLSVKASS
jgi:HK97 family phage major capsid protein